MKVNFNLFNTNIWAAVLFKACTFHYAVQSLSCVQFFMTPWTAACQVSLSSPSPRACSNSCLLTRQCHPTPQFKSISSSVLSSPTLYQVKHKRFPKESTPKNISNTCLIHMQAFLGISWGSRVGSSQWSRNSYAFNIFKNCSPFSTILPRFCQMPSIQNKHQELLHLQRSRVFRFWWWTAWIHAYLGMQQMFFNEIMSMSPLVKCN